VRSRFTVSPDDPVSHPALMDAYWRHYIVPHREATKALLRRA
jgi:hypothetical protein